MELRCTNCGERIHVDAAKTGQEIECPKCGVTMILPAQHPPGHAQHEPLMPHGEPRPTQRTLKRIFEPIPRPAAYLAGAVLFLIILSPFWLFLFQERFQRRPIILSEEAISNAASPAVTATNPPEPVLEVPHGAASVALDQYRGVRLDAAREDVQRRFGVRLQNTRGMVPQIYEAKKMGDIEQLTAHFYDDLLKEFFVVMRQQRTPPDAIEKELREEFGEPKERTEPPAEPGGVGLGGGLAGALGATGAREQPEAKPASFPHRRYLAWDDGRSRVDATIHYNSPDPAACTSLLAVHVSAAKWLNANRSRLGAVVPPPTNLVEQTNAPVAEFEPPKRLFP